MRTLLLCLALASGSLYSQNCTSGCGSVSGRSWLDTNRDGIRQDTEPPVLGVAEALINQGTDSFTVEIALDGTYTFPSLLPGEYLIQLTPGDSSLVSTQSRQGDDPTRDSDAIQGSSAVEIVVAAGQNVTGSTDIGWVERDVCELYVQDQIPPSCTSPTGSATLVAESNSGGAPVFTLDGEEIPSDGDTVRLTGLAPGFYRAEVVFPSGCTSLNIIAIPSEETAQIFQSGSLCTPDDPAKLNVSVDAGSEILSYAWSDGSTEPTLTDLEVETNYFVTITVEGGCELKDTTYIEQDEYNYAVPVLNLDCETGLATLNHPADLDPTIDLIFFDEGLRVPLPDGYEFDRADQYRVLTANTGLPFEDDGACLVSGFVFVNDGRLSSVDVFQEQPFDCFLDELAIVVEPAGFLSTGFPFSAAVTGPAESIVSDDSTQTYFRLFGAQEGIYDIEVSTYCGDTLLVTEVSIPDTCDLSDNVGGSVRLNEERNCVFNPNAPGTGIPATTVRLTSEEERSYYFLTDDTGDWRGRVPAGLYTATPLGPRESVLIACSNELLSPTEDSTTFQNNVLLMTESIDCANLSVTVTSNRLRRCFGNSAYLHYENQGSMAAENVLIKVVMDAFLIEITATETFTTVGDTLFFSLGDVPGFSSGRIRLDFTVSCESALGQLHCLEAFADADNSCGPLGNTAILDVTALGCEADSARFTVSNLGAAGMVGDLRYFVLRDGRQDAGIPNTAPGLAAGEALTFAFPRNGTSIELVVRQDEAYAGPVSDFPSAIVNDCLPPMAGNVTSFTSDNGFGTRYRYCRTNTGSFDPNEKLVFPGGSGFANEIEPGTRLTYELHFQNTGTDTAFTVVIRDTLPAALDIESIEFGSASHEYEVSIDANRELTFTFNDILLVDSFTNVAGSMGVVAFSVDHVDSLERGDEFRNRAGIYFDFNEPIITEYARTQLAVEPLLLSTRNSPSTPVADLLLYPNPASESIRVNVPGSTSRNLSIQLTDAYGRLVYRGKYQPEGTELSVRDLPNGLYVATVGTRGRTVARAKFIVAK